jgi:hypothetical protein
VHLETSVRSVTAPGYSRQDRSSTGTSFQQIIRFKPAMIARNDTWYAHAAGK